MGHLLFALLLVQPLPDGANLGQAPPSPDPPENTAEIHDWAEDRLEDFYLNSFKRYGMVFAYYVSERCDADDDPVTRCFFGDIDALPCPHQRTQCKPYKDPAYLFVGLQNALASAARRVPDDGFVVGQAVYALTKGGRYPQALETAEACEAERWRCSALMGYLNYKLDRREEATPYLLTAFEAAPDSVRCRWSDLYPLLRNGGERGRYQRMSCDERESFERRVWWLADPLWLVDGNDRWVEHLARKIEIDLHQEIWSLKSYLPALWVGDERIEPGGEDDYPIYEKHRTHHELDISLGGMDRGVVAIGFPDSWLHNRIPDSGLTATRGRLRRSNLSPEFRFFHYRTWVSERKARYRFFPESAVIDEPTSIELGEWTFEPGQGRERYTPDYGLFTAKLDHSRAHFLRGDSAIVAVALDLARSEGFGDKPRAVGLFFARSEADEPASLYTDAQQDAYVFRATVEDTAYLMSLEVVTPDLIGRVRYGVDGPWREEFDEGRRVVLSDLVVFEPLGAGLPEDVDAVVPLMRTPHGWEQGAELGLFWETYGLTEGESFDVSVRIGDVRGGFLSRIARAVTFTDRGDRTVAWRDSAEDDGGVISRTIVVDLDNVEPGEHEVEITVEVAGEPVARRRVRLRVVSIG
jgi:hypothetical protein